MGMIAISGCNRPETYIVTFNANGGSGTMAVQTFTEDEAQTLTRNAFTFEGYSFTGWNTLLDGSGVSYNDGQTITVTSDMTLYAQWTLNDPLNGHDFVDLSLPSGTLWATCNVGANAPEEYGDYFAWGETTTKEIYNWSNYRYGNSFFYGEDECWTLTKYCNRSDIGNNGYTDTLTTLQAIDDAATANWGAGWRMPNKDELNELRNNCTVTWTTQSGVNGRLFTGPNGNSIFLPAAGRREDDIIRYDGSYGYYRSSSLDIEDPNGAWFIEFCMYDYDIGGSDRFCGYPVRPVVAQ